MLDIIVVGLGHQSLDDHIPAIKDSNNFRLVGVVDTNEAIAEKVGTETGVPYSDNLDGAYLFTGLPIDAGNGDSKYVVAVTDGDHVLAGCANTMGAVRQDNNSQAAAGYSVTLSQTVTDDMTADFGYVCPVNLTLEKEVDGNNDGVFVKSGRIIPDVAYNYRIVVGNSSSNKATGVVVKDYLPAGVSILSTNSQQGSVMSDNGVITWDVGTLAATSQLTLTLHVVVRADDLDNFRSGLNGAGNSRNTAQITRIDQPDTNSTPDNMVLPFNPAHHEDDESYADSFMLGSIGDYAWVDDNANGIQDADERGLNNITVELRDANDAVIATTTTATNAGRDGYYTFGNLVAGDYKVHFVAPFGYTLTQSNAGGDESSDSNADAASGTTATIMLLQGQTNDTIDVGFMRLLSIGDTVWSDTNNNGSQDDGEKGLAGVTLMLYADSDGDGVLHPNKDTLIATTTTDTNGNYLFSNLLAGQYFVAISTSQLIGGQVLGGYVLSPVIGNDPNDTVNLVNDGVLYRDTGLITLKKPINLAYGQSLASNNTVDFGFHQPVPQTPQTGTSLADTGSSILLVSLVGGGMVLLGAGIFFYRHKLGNSNKK